jgi:hypothetical protein
MLSGWILDENLFSLGFAIFVINVTECIYPDGAGCFCFIKTHTRDPELPPSLIYQRRPSELANLFCDGFRKTELMELNSALLFYIPPIDGFLNRPSTRGTSVKSPHTISFVGSCPWMSTAPLIIYEDLPHFRHLKYACTYATRRGMVHHSSCSDLFPY